MATTATSVSLVLGTTATSTANRILAASTAVDRYIRHIYVANVSASPITINIGTGVAATLTAANADVCFGQTLAANSKTDFYYGGKGRLARGSGSVNEIMGFASAGSAAFVTVVYEEYPAG